MTVEVQVLKYKFRFRKLTWRDEFSLKTPPRANHLRYYLAAALTEVSGLPVTSMEDAMKVFGPMPTPVLDRVFKIYKTKLPPSRRFETANLYRAPEPQAYAQRVMEEVQKVDDTADRAVRIMEQKFGKEEIEEAKAIDDQIVRASQLRGAVKVPRD